MEIIRWIALLVLILFSAYTLYVAKTESFWKSVKTIWTFKWGYQVTMDLYIGLLLFSFIIYLNEASLLITIAWLVPILIIGNPVTLIYFVLHFDSIVSRFL